MTERSRRSSGSGTWWQRAAGIAVLSGLAIAAGGEVQSQPEDRGQADGPRSEGQPLLWAGATFAAGLACGAGVLGVVLRRQHAANLLVEPDLVDVSVSSEVSAVSDASAAEISAAADTDVPARLESLYSDKTDVAAGDDVTLPDSGVAMSEPAGDARRGSASLVDEMNRNEPADVLDLIRASVPPAISQSQPPEPAAAFDLIQSSVSSPERDRSESAHAREPARNVSDRSEEAVKRALLQCARDAIVILNDSLTIVEVNPLAVELFERDLDVFVGADAIDILFPAPERARLRHEALELIATETGPWSESRELHACKADGALITLDWVASRFVIHGRPHLIATARDTRPYKQAEAALQASEERYELAVRGANDGLWDWDLTTSTIEFSPRWKAMLGYEDQEISANPDEWFDRIHPDDRDRLIADITAHIKGETPHFESEYRMLQRDRTYIWVLSRGLAVRNERNVAYRMAGSQTDITERRIAEENAYRDALSDLPNREAFMKQLEEAVGRANFNSENNKFAVLFLDCDRFKVINDSLGHAVGDRLIQIVARRLEVCVRPLDMVARLGGDEFVMLLREIKSIDDATVVADRILQQIMQPFRIDGHEVFVTASIGIVSSDIGHRRAETILRDADTAMYRAKALGKSRYVVFDESMYSGAVQRQRIESDLRRALDNREFHLAYQPIVSVDTGHLSGFEALLRWRHPERSWISPAEFIPVAEDMGLIAEIGEWVLEAACRQMRDWHQQFPQRQLTISVNFTSNQIIQPHFVEIVQDTIARSGCDPHSLRIELTESAIVENMETACHHLQSLRVLGVQAYIDDFGTGYSSLSYLQTLPLDALKIDRSFISNTESQPHSWKIVETIVTLAQSLGIVTIAEGVETQEQFSRLRELGCEYIQGYFISPPLDNQRAAAFISEELSAAPRVSSIPRRSASARP